MLPYKKRMLQYPSVIVVIGCRKEKDSFSKSTSCKMLHTQRLWSLCQFFIVFSVFFFSYILFITASFNANRGAGGRDRIIRKVDVLARNKLLCVCAAAQGRGRGKERRGDSYDTRPTPKSPLAN